ncbi:MAG: hypothetical protein RQ862_11110 [Candidatus Caldarchaeales archaeon]|jgi:hypothetical protein|nr:hypothetical protein [Candidatus Caldarchaeales archaeon]
MAHHPRTYKTPKELILPREKHYTQSSIEGLEKKVGVVRKEKPKLEHSNITIQLDLWGNEVIFRGKGQTTLYGYPC